ncbi:MAG: acyl-CoA dehydrogenase [Actinomycetia bacterium]|nr:acyl-CoA dehydrogenase [Actinomycetes bacterium]
MRFSFDDDQLAFRDTVRDLLAKECTPDVIRAAWAAEVLDRGVWDQLAEMGVLGILAPEAAGGMGLDERWLVLLLEECGYAGLPHPIVETAAVAMPLVADRVEPNALITTDLGGPLVPAAADADQLLVADGAAGLVLVAGPDVVIEEAEVVDRGRRAGRVAWEPSVVSGVAGDRDLAFDRGAWGAAAFLVGLGQRMLDITVEYVKEREQFGVPIGSFQAVKHHLADAALQLAFARPAVERAAWSLAVGDEHRSRDVSMAKAMASDAVRLVGRKALQCHGAIGYTEEADLHLFLKRSWALQRTWGDADWHRDRIGRALGI